MPRTVTAILPDGQKVVYQNVPDDATPEQVTARVQAEHGVAPKELDGGKADQSDLMHKAKMLGSSAVKGVLGFPALAVDVIGSSLGRDVENLRASSAELRKNGLTWEWLTRGPAPVRRQPPQMPASKALQSFGEAPKTKGEEWADVITQGLSGGLATPGSLVSRAAAVNNAAAGVGSAVAGKAAEQAGFGGVGQVVASLLGGGVSAAASNLATRKPPRVGELAKEALDGVTPAKLAEAEAFMRESAKQGVELDLAQALEAVSGQSGGLRTVRDTLANVKEGDATQALLRAQPGNLQQLVATEMAKLPSNVYSPEQAANNLSETATAVIEGAKGRAGEAWRSTHDATLEQLKSPRKAALQQAVEGLGQAEANWRQKPGWKAWEPVKAAKAAVAGAEDDLANITSVSTEVVRGEQARLLALAEQASTKTAKGRALATLAKNMEGVTDGNTLNEILKDANAKAKTTNLSTPGMDAATSKWLQAQVAAIRRNFGEASLPVRAANTAFARVQNAEVAPLKQGVEGALVGRTGYNVAVQAPVSRMEALFSAGRDPQTKHSPLLAAARRLNKQDPEAFRDAAKTYYSGKVAEAFDAGIGTGGSPTNKDAGERIYNALFKDQKQFTGLRDTVTAMAESANIPPAEALRGLDKFAMIVKATRSQPDRIGGMTQQQILEMASKHYGANAVRIFGFLPFERMARNLEDATMSKTLRELDKLITTPEGAKILAELAKQPTHSKSAMALAATAGGALQFVGKTDQSNE